MSRLVKTSALVLLVALAGCGGGAFSPSFRDNNLDDLKAALSGARPPADFSPVNRTGKPLVFLVTGDPTQIVAYDLESKKELWKTAANITSKVVVGKARIFHRSGKGTLVARDLTSGRKLWQHTILGGDRLLGMTTDGNDLYYVTEYVKRAEDGTAATLVALKGSNGSARFKRPSRGRLGAPTAHGNKLFIPLRSQSMALVDALTGEEVARIRSKEEMILWARPTPAGFLYGGKSGVYKLDDKSISGTKAESTFLAATLPSSVRPVYWWDGYNAALAGYTAYDRNRLLWQLQGKGDTFQQDTIFVHNYRFFFAFDTKKKSGNGPLLKWVYSFPRHDVVASIHTGKALLLVADNGTIVTLDPATGVPTQSAKVGLNVRGASFDARGMAPSEGAKAEPNLRESLTQVIWDPDRRFGAVKLFAVEQLARLTGETVSGDLVKIVTREGIDPAVYKLAGQMIVDRHDAKALPIYLDTLRPHYDFLEATRAAAVDIMARAVGDLKSKEAVKPLLKHLKDPETPIPAVEAIIKALIAIGDKSVVIPFRDWLLYYRADSNFKDASLVLNLIADGLLQLGGEEERQLLRFVQNDSQTIKPLRTYLAEALKRSDAEDEPTATMKDQKKGGAAKPAKPEATKPGLTSAPAGEKKGNK